MFHKKHTVKEVQAIGKSDVKKIKANVVAVIGRDFEDVLDGVWDKKAAVSRRRWQFGAGASTNLYLVNELPLFISVDGLPADAENLLPKGTVKGSLVPTLFFLLRARCFLQDDPDRFVEFVSQLGTNVYCRGPTSRFLLSGAHLMIPGILATSKSDVPTGSLALVSSIGTNSPYAVGFTTSRFAESDATGVGVYIINCFTDDLWKEFEAVFVTLCSDTSGGRGENPLPVEFLAEEVLENLPQSEAAPAAESTELKVDLPPTGNVPPEGATENENTTVEVQDAEEHVTDGDALAVHESALEENTNGAGDSEAAVDDFSSLFTDEDAILAFAFFEAVKGIPSSAMPLPVTQFTATLVNAYPRLTEDAKPIDFKNTKHKRALTFLKTFDDVVEIAEVNPGVHSITKINKSSVQMRDHNRKFKVFLESVQKPAKEKEGRAAELRLMQDKKTVFNQQILSVESNFRPRRNTNMPDTLAHVIFGDDIDMVVASETQTNLPTLEDVEKGVKSIDRGDSLPPVDDDAYSCLYPRKAITSRLRAYVKARGLMEIPGAKGSMPLVRLEGSLSSYQPLGDETGRMSLDKLDETVLKRHFNLVTEITVQTSVSGSATMSEYIPPRHIVKNGPPPHINVWTEKRSGNKVITILKNMEALGFDLDILCRAWRQRFSTSCSVFDPAAEMTNLKSGTKIPVEIHVQGDITSKLSSVLTKELGIPSGLIQNNK